MDFFTGLMAFLIIWWTALFMVLPLWVRQPAKHQTGHMPGAPEHPHLMRKALVTTGVSAMIWLVVFGLIQLKIIDFRAISVAMTQEDETR
ncbi:MAG: DUF1467 family protein [Alphaproteobacteria bacterium]|nr:DUF1467 family protein [Alphaproteobacteria bacterium]